MKATTGNVSNVFHWKNYTTTSVLVRGTDGESEWRTTRKTERVTDNCVPVGNSIREGRGRSRSVNVGGRRERLSWGGWKWAKKDEEKPVPQDWVDPVRRLTTQE